MLSTSLNRFTACPRDIRDSWQTRATVHPVAQQYSRSRVNCTTSSSRATNNCEISQVQTLVSDFDQPGPEHFDILLSDVPREDVPTKLSEFLRCPYLSPASEGRFDSINGAVYGRAMRMFFTLPVCCPRRGRPKPVNAHFLLDTSSLITYLEPRLLDILNLPTYDLDSVVVEINGVNTRVSNSDEDKWVSGQWRPSHFKGVNILGMQYIELAEAKLELWSFGGSTDCKLSFTSDS
ncbi:hypothetical protein WJX73_002079 [Symbiochloris irregularis]|uniref:Uncharacterized protein n=1 Tax=Symbiochloris irregularis TaxID=706552 RepID=A0AAW1NT91_9CHLO